MKAPYFAPAWLPLYLGLVHGLFARGVETGNCPLLLPSRSKNINGVEQQYFKFQTLMVGVAVEHR
jgi:hypothetical protein